MSEADAFSISRATLGQCHVLTPEGSLTNERSGQLREMLVALAEGHEPQVVLNLQSVALMDSAAIQVIADGHRAMQKRGGRLKLVQARDVCLDILRATRLLFEIEVCRDLNEAIRQGGS
jgi:anti-anti-sigma factor